MKQKANQKFIVQDKLVLQLYVSGMSQKSMQAVENIKKICDEHLEGAFELEIIDIYKNPELATERQIVFSPSLVRKFPLPKKTMIGNLSDAEKVIKGLGITIKQ